MATERRYAILEVSDDPMRTYGVREVIYRRDAPGRLAMVEIPPTRGMIQIERSELFEDEGAARTELISRCEEIAKHLLANAAWVREGQPA